jgi:hypothetical protein
MKIYPAPRHKLGEYITTKTTFKMEKTGVTRWFWDALLRVNNMKEKMSG